MVPRHSEALRRFGVKRHPLWQRRRGGGGGGGGAKQETEMTRRKTDRQCCKNGNAKRECIVLLCAKHG